MASINVKFAQTFSFQIEGSYAQLSVARDSSSTFSGAFSVDYSFIPINATPGLDFDATPGTLNFSEGENLKNIVVPIYNDSVTDPLESFIVNLSNLQAPGSSSSAITTSAHSVYIVDTAPAPEPEPDPTPTETETETYIPPTETTTQTQTESQTDTETQTLIWITPTSTETLTHTASETKTTTDIPIEFPVVTPEPINPYPTCWCTPIGPICPPRPRPVVTPTSTPTYMILPPDAPNYVIVDGRCYKKTETLVNTTDLNYNYGGDFSNCQNCNETLFQASDPVPTPGSEDHINAPLDPNEIYQKYVLASVFDDRYWQNSDQNSNLIYGNLLYNQEPVYGAYAFVYNKDGTLANQSLLSSSEFNINIAHDPANSYSITFEHESFGQYSLEREIIFQLPGQKFSTGDLNINNV